MTTQSDALNAPAVFTRPLAPGNFSIGLGLTNECNLSCSFCYRDPTRVDRLDHAGLAD